MSSQVGFPLQLFSKNLGPLRFCFSASTFGNVVSPLLTDSLSKMQKVLYPLFKLLNCCQDVNMVTKLQVGIHTKVTRCVEMFSLLTDSTRNTKDFSQIINNFSLCFENFGTGILKQHLSVAVSRMKNFHCNLPFLF